jgi:hypothetical protein
MAARVKSTINPALLTWVRETAGFTPAEAANRLIIDEAWLAAWEDLADEDARSILQLRKVAALFKRPLAVFYLEEAPPHFALAVAARPVLGLQWRRSTDDVASGPRSQGRGGRRCSSEDSRI